MATNFPTYVRFPDLYINAHQDQHFDMAAQVPEKSLEELKRKQSPSRLKSAPTCKLTATYSV